MIRCALAKGRVGADRIVLYWRFRLGSPLAPEGAKRPISLARWGPGGDFDEGFASRHHALDRRELFGGHPRSPLRQIEPHALRSDHRHLLASSVAKRVAQSESDSVGRRAR